MSRLCRAGRFHRRLFCALNSIAAPSRWRGCLVARAR